MYFHCRECERNYKKYWVEPGDIEFKEHRCLFCGTEDLIEILYADISMEEWEKEMSLKKKNSIFPQPFPGYLVTHIHNPTSEEQDYIDARKEELNLEYDTGSTRICKSCEKVFFYSLYEDKCPYCNSKDIISHESINTCKIKPKSSKTNSKPPLNTMPAGVPYKSSEYYLYNSHKNEGYGCLIVVLCLLCILCGQWYMIFAVLFMYGRFCNQNNKDLDNSPDIQKHREIAKDVRENSVYSEEFLEEERKRLGL